MLGGKTDSEHKRLGWLKKALATACISLGMLSMPLAASAEEDGNLETVYHVYIDGKHVGKTNNRSVIEKIVDEKIADGEEKYDNFTMVIGENLTVVPEKVFNPTYDNNNVSNILKKDLSVQVKAVELQIADETVGYFKDKATAEAVMKEYKALYVDEKELEKLEAKQGKDQTEGNEKLSVGDTNLLDVKLSENVSFSEQKVLPKKLLTMEQGIQLLKKGTLKEDVYTVKKGDVLGSIAQKHDLSIEQLLNLNPGLDEETLLQIGQKINVTEYKPFIDVIVQKEKMVEETIQHETEVIESDELYKGEKKVKQEGKDGKKRVHYTVEFTNGKVTSKKVIEEQVTDEPVKRIIVKGTKVIPSRGTGNLHWPAVGGYVSSDVGKRWGRMHKGIDIARPSSRAILAADNGVVVEAGWEGSFGNRIVISHNNGMKTLYAHLSSINVHVGQTVERGSTIGIMGATGNATGVHLHFEVYVNGELQRPLDYF